MTNKVMYGYMDPMDLDCSIKSRHYDAFPIFIDYDRVINHTYHKPLFTKLHLYPSTNDEQDISLGKIS